MSRHDSQYSTSSFDSIEKPPYAYAQGIAEDPELGRKKIVLCFDGTSNQFKGNDSDTNVVKIFQMFDRADKRQYHYYQPGIGTYRANSRLQNTPETGFLAKGYSTARAKADEVLASTFADHVMAGYKFLMRYYMEGDKIYIFGFSRGAYTARFLCELIFEMGILSKGNEEMLPFVWYQYLHYRLNSDDGECKLKMDQMRQTFCRPKVEVFWLGLWDCVNSVAQLSGPGVSHHAPPVTEASPNIAKHVRHAVSCHERRVKFKPTLFIKEPNRVGTLKEVWFAGNHGDIGGGWTPNQGMLLSDIALIWMVEELMHQESNDHEALSISWRTTQQEKGISGEVKINTYQARRAKLVDAMMRLQRGKLSNPDALWHDTLDPTHCRKDFKSYAMLPVWWAMELLPLSHTVLMVKRGRDWVRTAVKRHGQDQTVMRKSASHLFKTTHKPNLGRNRNIPLDAKFHPSVKQLHDAGVIKAMAKWQYGPSGYKALVKEETMSQGRPSESLPHDHYMFIC